MLSKVDASHDIELLSSFDFLSKDYAALFARSDAHAFQHPLRLDAFYRHLAPNRSAERHVLVARARNTTQLDLVLPLILRRKSGFRLLETTDLGVSDYSAPVASPDFWAALEQQPDMSRRVLQTLPKCDLLRIRPVRDDDCRKFEKLLVGSQPEAQGFSSHAVKLSAPYDEWRKANINGSLRKMIDRKTRKLGREQDITLSELRDEGEIRGAIEAIAKLRAGRFEGDVIQDGFAKEFYSDVAANGAGAGLASTWRMRAGDTDVGIVFGLTHAGRFYYLLIGCDYDQFGTYSPGLQLYDAIMRDWTEKGGKVFDFTIGDEAFKAKFGTSPTPIYAFLIPRSPLGRLARILLRRK